MWINEVPSKSLVQNSLLRETHRDLVRQGGSTNHSARGMTLGLIIRRLEEERVPYTLEARPGFGYVLTVKKPEERDHDTNSD